MSDTRAQGTVEGWIVNNLLGNRYRGSFQFPPPSRPAGIPPYAVTATPLVRLQAGRSIS
jgi:hypothetical protein